MLCGTTDVRGVCAASWVHGGRRGGRGVGCVCALIHCTLEEVVLQRIVGRDPRLRVEVQHTQDQVLKTHSLCYNWITEGSLYISKILQKFFPARYIPL